MSEYRNRIYRYYVSARDEALAPADTNGFNPRAPYLNRLIRNHFPADRNAAIIDLGCGHGALIHFARLAGYQNMRGVDVSPEQVSAAKKLGIEGVEQADLLSFLSLLQAESADLVIAFDVIEHFTKDELFGFVDQVHRVLKRNGRWIIHTTNGESPFFGRSRYGDLTHELTFTRRSIHQVLLSCGFHNIRCFEDTPVLHGVKSVIRWGLWKIIRSVLRLYIAAETGDTDSGIIFTQNFLAVAEKR